MQLLFHNTKLVPLTDNWFDWLNAVFGPNRPACSLGIWAHNATIEVTINTPEYTILYLYYLKTIGATYTIMQKEEK